MEIGTDTIGEQGCHLTWPELRHLSKQELSLSWSAIKDRRVDYAQLPSYFCTIMNLKGFVRYSLDEEEEAESVFITVLETDSENVCALGNLAVLCYRQSRLSEHKEYVSRLQTIINRQSPIVRARSYYDRAHTIRHFEQDKRKFTYIPFIKKAVDIAEKVTVLEKTEWLFDYGLALYRKDCQLTAGNASESALEGGFREASKCFNDVIEMKGFCGNRALSWVFLGLLLRNQSDRKFEVSLPDIKGLHGLSAMDCLNKALELQPSHPIVLRRVGAEMVQLKEFDKARTLLDLSIKLERSWFALRHRGLLNLALYEESGSTSEASQREYLDPARHDFEAAMTLKQVHADYSDLGYVYFLYGNYQKALKLFSCADRCTNDDNFNPAVTHRRWARCLHAIGESTGAKKQEGKAAEVDAMLSKQANAIEEAFYGHGANCQGFECDLERFNYSAEERPGFVSILSEERHPLTIVGNPFPFSSRQSNYKYDFFISFSHIDHKWTLLFFRKLERELEVRGCIRYRDYECGNAIAANISNSIRESAKIIVVISPDSIRDPWCKYEVRKSHAESLSRSYACVIPIMLRICKIPEEFELMTYIKCNDGQLTTEDWYRLGKSLFKKV
ncbi:Toll-like receptor 4 [Holothuria leucospilota]|uniref:Toll-like receptor 4 n=1 Tax=Holothuria leucospilota TaxID=206669 RepID=A0A9Q0YS85_HOLLE|nr:Toll-like receptor 4 [Holothuria leucospilota]